MADVLSQIDAVPVDFCAGFVGFGLGFGYGFAQGADAQDASAGSDDSIVAQRSAGMEYFDVRWKIMVQPGISARGCAPRDGSIT